MPLTEGWALQGYGTRTAALALRAAREQHIAAPGMAKNLYRRLSALICWDAAMICAWIARGVDLIPPPGLTQLESDVYYHNASLLDLVTRNSYGNLFTQPGSVNSAAAISGIPDGSFIGFVNQQGKLEHVMLYVGNGLAAGANNACIFAKLCVGGWEVLDLNYFFKSAAFKNGSRMIFTRVFGQTIQR